MPSKQPGLKNLTDQEQWFWWPAAIASYSGRLSDAHASVAWHGTLSEMGMIVILSTLTVGLIAQTLSADAKPTGEANATLEKAFPRFADDLTWWARSCEKRNPRIDRRRSDGPNPTARQLDIDQPPVREPGIDDATERRHATKPTRFAATMR
jgi:hypothetical protein